MNQTGGLKIYTTLTRSNQRAAQHAVNYMLPPPPNQFNPASNAATEVLIQPGTGRVRAIALDRPYGTGPGQTNVDYAVDTTVQRRRGRADRLLVQAVHPADRAEAGHPVRVQPEGGLAGHRSSATPTARASRSARRARWPTPRGRASAAFTLYNGTTQSINVFFAHLEQQVGLCNVVKTAPEPGRAPRERHLADSKAWASRAARTTSCPADDIPSFTLGSVNVSPMTMAAAYADGRRPGHVLRADRHPADRRPHRGTSCRSSRPAATGCCPSRSPTRRTTSCRACWCPRHRGRRPVHPARRDPAAGRQDRHRQRLRLRRVRRVHPAAGRLRGRCSTRRPTRSMQGPGLLLPAGQRLVLLRRRDVRRELRHDLAVHLPAREPGPVHCPVRPGARGQPVLLPGRRRELAQAAEEEEATAAMAVVAVVGAR